MDLPPNVALILARHKASQLRSEAQQGLGRGIVTTIFNGQRVIAVGDRIFTGHWKTVPEFLMHYLKRAMGAEWGKRESARFGDDRHPIIQWLDVVAATIAMARSAAQGEYFAVPVTGASQALLGLAYNLYLLAHNAELHDKLVKRLRAQNQFHAAYYETMVSSWFILAGYSLTMIDDPSQKNAEFTAIAPGSGKTYSVEAKARQPNKGHLDIGNQLYQGLKKVTTHPRIIFIDINIPQDSPDKVPDLGDQLTGAIKGREATLTIDGVAAPPAYVMVTNHPYHYRSGEVGTTQWLLPEGFKIPDFGYSAAFPSVRLQFEADERHADVMSVARAFERYRVPITFDGEVPEFAFGEASRRWQIGESYPLEQFGATGEGRLTGGVVMVRSKVAHLIFDVAGVTSHFTSPMTDAEISAYQGHPETFFGVIQSVGTNVTTPLDFFKFIYSSNKSTPKERLLSWMTTAPDFAALSELPRDELAKIYAEGVTRNHYIRSQKNDHPKGPAPQG